MQDTSANNSDSLFSDSTHTLITKDSISTGEGIFKFIDSSAISPVTEKPAAAQTYINFFSGHESPVIHKDAIPYRDSSPDWLFYVLLVVVAALAWIRYFYGKIFGQTLQALFNVNITNQIVRDENILIQRTSSFLGIIFNVVLAIMLYHVSNHFRWKVFNINNSFGKFLFFLLAISAIYSFKFLLLKVTGYVFSIEKEMATYIFNILLINNMLGLLMIPLAVILSFSFAPHVYILVIAVCLFGLAFIYRILRGTLIGLSCNGVSLIHLFLYFCALEFVPLAVLIKLFTE